MHENGLVRDLMARVEEEVDGRSERVTALRFRVGALSGVDPDTLRQSVWHYTDEAWGRLPTVEVESSDDPTDPGALGVRLVSIGLGS